VILESSSKDNIINLGEGVDMMCKAQGYPKPKISWIRADGKPLPDGSVVHEV
jgi:hypothetical protein